MWLTRAGRLRRVYSSSQIPAGRGRRPAAELRGPAEADEPGRAELLLPRDAHVEPDVLVARPTATLELGVLTDDVRREPRRDVAPEPFGVVGELDVRHPVPPLRVVASEPDGPSETS